MRLGLVGSKICCSTMFYFDVVVRLDRPDHISRLSIRRFTHLLCNYDLFGPLVANSMRLVSRLYKPTAAIEEIGTSEPLTLLSVLDVPLLEPLTITKAKYFPDVGAVLLKLTLPNGSEAIAYTASAYNDIFQNSELDFPSHISGSLFRRSDGERSRTHRGEDAVPRAPRGMKT
jgi:hypothetical protein